MPKTLHTPERQAPAAHNTALAGIAVPREGRLGKATTSWKREDDNKTCRCGPGTRMHMCTRIRNNLGRE